MKEEQIEQIEVGAILQSSEGFFEVVEISESFGRKYKVVEQEVNEATGELSPVADDNGHWLVEADLNRYEFAI